MVPSSNWLGGQPFTLEIGVQTSVESPPWLARLSINTPVINPVQVFSMFLPGITNYKETTAPQVADRTEKCESDEMLTLWEEISQNVLAVCITEKSYIKVVTTGVWYPNSLNKSKPSSEIKEVPSGRVSRPQKYPTHLWFTTPTGRVRIGRKIFPKFHTLRCEFLLISRMK